MIGGVSVRVRVSTHIAAPRRQVWARIRDLTTHAEWMEEAADIRIVGDRRSGRGTVMEVATTVGPFRVTDRMEVDEWREGRSIGVRHVGKVRGGGRFLLRRSVLGGTRFTWDERLRFPWWLGGPVGERVGGVVLRRVWRRNLRQLKALVEGDRQGSGPTALPERHPRSE